MKAPNVIERAIRNPQSAAEGSARHNQRPGTLYVVSTPIGNLEDITLRALKVLRVVDTIAAENSARTRGLCEHYGIKSRLTSFHQHNQHVKIERLINRLKSGRDLAFVTDAGTPGISDPGGYLVNRVVEEGIKAVPVPGPCAVVAALSVSGLPTNRFVFVGFMSTKPGKRKRELEKLVSETRTMVFFEAPHRIKAMLADLFQILGDRQMVLHRELTKLFEEAERGPVSHILESLTPEKTRGEFTLVVAGNEAQRKARGLNKRALDRLEGLLREKTMSTKDIAKLVSNEEGLAYRKVYKECLARKGAFEGFETDGIGQET